jgi:hypothetical protein
MRKALFLMLVMGGLAVAAFGQVVPVVDTIDHAIAAPGSVITAVGVNLEKEKVAEVFLTDGLEDLKVVILEQKGNELKFKVPINARLGIFNIMLETAQEPPVLLVQPVKCEIISETEE